MRKFDLFSNVMREGEGGGGGGGGGGGAATNWDYADLPEGLRGKDNAETYGKVKGEYFNLRTKMSEFQPGKDATEYKFDPADPIKPYFKNADDPWTKTAQAAAQKAGVPVKMFGAFMNEMFTAAHGAKLLPEPFNADQHIEQIGKLVAPGKSPAETKTAVEAALTEAAAFAPAYADHHKMSPAAKILLASIADEAGGVELLRHLKQLGAEKGIQLGGEGSRSGAYTAADYDKDVADPRYNPFSSKYDKAWRESIDAKSKTLFGGPSLP